MNYTAADPIIDQWSREHSIPWVREYQDEEVRSADVYMASGTYAQLWLEPQVDVGVFAVCAWDRDSRRFREVASTPDLHPALNRALSAIRSWG